MKHVAKQLKSVHWLLVLIALFGGVAGFAGMRLLSSNAQTVKAAKCDAICVTLKPDGMYPNELAIKVGQTVQFNAADGKHHNLAEGDGAHGHEGHADPDHHDHVGGFVSGEFGPDEAWRVSFKKPGTYRLHDHYNPKQTILIVVYKDN